MTLSNELSGSPFDNSPLESEMPGERRYKFDLLKVVSEIHGATTGVFDPPGRLYMAERVVWLMDRLRYWNKSSSTYDLLVFTLANEALMRWQERERQLDVSEP